MPHLMRRRIKLGYFFTFTASAALLLAVGMIGSRQRATNYEAINRIDHTGRLRMLGQRAVQKASLIHNGMNSPEVESQLSDTKAEFETILSGLKNGNADLGLAASVNSGVVAKILLIEGRWQDLSNLMQKQESESAKEHEIVQLLSVEHKLLEACEQLMAAERQQLEVVGVTVLHRILLGCIVFVLLLGVAMLWILRRKEQLLLAAESAKKSDKLLLAMQKSEARLKAMMASSLDPLLTVNMRGLVQTASDTVESVFGWKPEELIGQNIKVLMPEPYRSEHDGYLAKYQRTKISSLLGKPREVPARRRDGSIFPSLLTLWQVDFPDQSETVFMGVIRDISKQKQAEAELTRFRAALDVSPDAVFLIDRNEMRFIDMNETACLSMGYSRDELLSMSPQDIKPNITGAELAQKFDEIIKTEDGVGVIETQHCCKDGSVFPVEVFLRALENDGRTIFIASVRDLTERKRCEEELTSLHRQLVDAARQAGMAEVATSVLHNVGNVLNSVNVSAGLIQDKIHNSGTSSLTKAVGVIEEHLENLGDYVTRDERGKHLPRFLIDLNQRMSGDEQLILEEVHSLMDNIDHIKAIVATQQSYATGMSAVVEKVSLAKLIEDAIHINMASMDRHSVKVKCHFEELEAVLLDKQKFLQIAVNLISNAKYACLESSNEDHQLTVSLRRSSEDWVSIEVRDNGVGIAKENLTRIFSHGFTTRKEGHGFGLHSSALAAKELRGNLTAESEGPGAGATFTLNVPYQGAGVSLCTN